MIETEPFPVTPTFDAAVVACLAREVDDQAFAAVFVRRYRQLLTARVSRVNQALFVEDVETALDATLSLKVSSSTVGACELADLALIIEDKVRCTDVVGAQAAAARLPAAAARVDRALVDYLRD